MITPKELLDKSNKLFYKIISAHFRGENLFPLVIPSNKQVTGTNFSQLKKDLVPLYQSSKAVKGKGYTIDWKEKKINGSTQSIPNRIYFESLDDFLFFINKDKEFHKIETARKRLVNVSPALESWTCLNPSLLLEYADHWVDIIKVCEYFVRASPPHNFYLRELPIEVHSKFIEQNADILKQILDELLPVERINNSEKDFSSRYFLKKVSIYTQIRILDDQLKTYLGYDDISLTVDDAAWLKWTPQNVFIIENQICYLTFPKIKNSVAIFGEGFKSRLSKHLPWLEKTNLYCWFDLDAAGFEMLNMIKEHYPNTKSLLMDNHTYSKFSNFAVNNLSRKKELRFLSIEERMMYDFLTTNGKRLEQERIPQNFILSCLGVNDQQAK
jgi:hypothetical protein